MNGGFERGFYGTFNIEDESSVVALVPIGDLGLLNPTESGAPIVRSTANANQLLIGGAVEFDAGRLLYLRRFQVGAIGAVDLEDDSLVFVTFGGGVDGDQDLLDVAGTLQEVVAVGVARDGTTNTGFARRFDVSSLAPGPSFDGTAIGVSGTQTVFQHILRGGGSEHYVTGQSAPDGVDPTTIRYWVGRLN